MKHLKTYLLMAGLLVFFSCKKVIEPKDLPQQDVRLVLNSILYTDTFITANISLSKSILSGKDYKFVNNATCDLYEDNVFLQSMANTSNGDYFYPVLAKTNKRYTIKVSAIGYKSIDATTSMPGNVAITGVEHYDTINSAYHIYDFDNGNGTGSSSVSGLTKFRFRIIDDPNVKNHYSIQPIIKVFDSLGTEVPIYVNANISSNITGNNSSSIFGSGDNSNGLTLDFDDQTLVNGKEVQADISISIYINTPLPGTISVIKQYLAIYNINEDYYRYKSTLNSQVTTGVSLFAEPVMVYSNVSSGMGILAGANTNTVFIFSGKPTKN